MSEAQDKKIRIQKKVDKNQQSAKLSDEQKQRELIKIRLELLTLANRVKELTI